MTKANMKQNRFMVALLTNSTVSEAAKESDISESTAYKYLNDPDFIKQYDSKRKEILTSSCHMLQAKMGRAAEELIKIIEEPNTAPQVRLNAIDMLYRHAYKQTELMDIITRLELLEERARNEYY